MNALVKEHASKRAEMLAENEKLRDQTIAAAGAASAAFLDQTNRDTALAFTQEKALEAEIKALQTETSKFVKRANQWVTLVAQFNASLKEIGDIENWSREIEKDMADVVGKLETIHGAK